MLAEVVFDLLMWPDIAIVVVLMTLLLGFALWALVKERKDDE